jgi:predicted DNA-binding antitoxin AbrB/MazE fold protein
MTYHAEAIYEGGILRPLTPLDLKEHEVVSLSISTAGEKDMPDSESARQRSESARQRSVLLAHVAKVESRPDDTPQDGFSNRDHDRLIYGK